MKRFRAPHENISTPHHLLLSNFHARRSRCRCSSQCVGELLRELALRSRPIVKVENQVAKPNLL